VEVRESEAELVDGDVSEPDHLAEPIGKPPVDHALTLEDGKEGGDRIRQAVLLCRDDVGGQVDGGSDRALEVEDEDILDLVVRSS
jgi:hypothetical protein